MLLLKQNYQKATDKSIKATVVGSARVMSYENIVEAKKKQRDIKKAEAEVNRGRRSKGAPSAWVHKKKLLLNGSLVG